MALILSWTSECLLDIYRCVRARISHAPTVCQYLTHIGFVGWVTVT
nr:MAG TPA: hypothetical protein [Caudoviricetes sp.]